jgi:hypothetical protein
MPTNPEAPGGEKSQQPGSERAPSRRSFGPKKELLTEPELKTMVADSISSLAGELAQGKSERLEAYLSFASRFHKYSRANQWLIMLQNPDATRVGSYKKWQDEGYQVAKGQTGIRILAPRFQKTEDKETGEEKRIVIGYYPVSIFDVSSQTTNVPLSSSFPWKATQTVSMSISELQPLLTDLWSKNRRTRVELKVSAKEGAWSQEPDFPRPTVP